MENRERSSEQEGFPRKRLLLIFIDGLGIGTDDPVQNPLSRIQASILRSFTGSSPILPQGGMALSNDPGMGIPGLPQSATGQAALFTGVNTAAAVGRHLSGFPNAILKSIVGQHSIMKRLKETGREVAFANTYTESYLEKVYPDPTAEKRNNNSLSPSYPGPGKKSVTTIMNETAGLRFRTELDLVEKKGLHMDFSNRFLRDRGYDIPLRTPHEAAEILTTLAGNFDFCLYEFFFTDLIGHRGNIEEAVALLDELDSFLFHVVSLMNFEESSLMITSDHGNIEDMSTRQHTNNMVPLFLWGKIRNKFKRDFDPIPIEEICPAIFRFLSSEE